MDNLIERVTNAIFRQEGMGPTYKNPGNLRGAPWFANPEITNGFWQPLSRAQGVAGAAHVVALHIAKGDSLRKLLTGWAFSFQTRRTLSAPPAMMVFPSLDAPEAYM